MGYVEGSSRDQSFIMNLEDMVASESKVRVIDRFVDTIDLERLGFTNTTPSVRGRTSYSPACMVKLYMFGYEKGVRSSRKLEALCNTDIEAMWLMESLKPDFKTIADFRKDNVPAFKALFGEFSRFLDGLGLYGKDIVAIDGTKVKASNSKKKHFSKKKLEQHRDYNGRKADEYLEALDAADTIEQQEAALAKAESHTQRKRQYEQMLDELKVTGIDEVALTDTDARMMRTGSLDVAPAYNIQAAVDGANHLVSAFSVTTDTTDYGQLSEMAQKTKGAVGEGKKPTTFLADKGYFDGDDLAECERLGLDVIVAARDIPTNKDRGDRFQAEHFTYDKATDSYTCPEGAVLASRSKKSTENRSYHNSRACKSCEHKDLCVPKNSNKRVIRRRPNSDTLDKAREKYAQSSEAYKQRQQIVEHVFGTIKHTMDTGYLLLRGKPKAEAEMALAFTGYNLKRAYSILGFDKIMEELDALAHFFLPHIAALFPSSRKSWVILGYNGSSMLRAV